MPRLLARYGPVPRPDAVQIHLAPRFTKLPAETGRPGGRALAWAGIAFWLALAAYVADVAMHPLLLSFRFFDLNIYNHAGLLVRHAPAALYTWHFMPGVQYLYTPFAALAFAVGSLLPWAVLKWLMAAVSFAAVLLTVWVTFSQLGLRGRRRQAAVLGVGAVAMWMEPVLVSLQQGQIELVLMALIAWDLCQPDSRRWKGAAVGVAAGIKLVPLIFVLYLALAGKLRQAAVAAAAFAGSALLGFAALPGESVKWWLTGYFLHAGDFPTLSLGSRRNQSLLAMVTRTPAGPTSATALWLGAAVVAGCLGLAAAAQLDRSGRPTAGWLTCAVTGVLVSPISWDDHWVWIVPMLVLLTDAAVCARRAARLAAGRSPRRRRRCSRPGRFTSPDSAPSSRTAWWCSAPARIPWPRSSTCTASSWSAGTSSCWPAWGCSRSCWPGPRLPGGAGACRAGFLFRPLVNRRRPGCNREAMDDTDLIAAMAVGDDAALRELFSRHAPWLAARLPPGRSGRRLAVGDRPAAGGAVPAPPRPGRADPARRHPG